MKKLVSQGWYAPREICNMPVRDHLNDSISGKMTSRSGKSVDPADEIMRTEVNCELHDEMHRFKSGHPG